MFITQIQRSDNFTLVQNDQEMQEIKFSIEVPDGLGCSISCVNYWIPKQDIQIDLEFQLMQILQILQILHHTLIIAKNFLGQIKSVPIACLFQLVFI